MVWFGLIYGVLHHFQQLYRGRKFYWWRKPDMSQVENKLLNLNVYFNQVGHCGRDRMVIGFNTTYAISAYHH
jgi:hypothetical protein